jgi:hypothetical protein
MVRPEPSPSRRQNGELGETDRRDGVVSHLQVARAADESGATGMGSAEAAALPPAVLPAGWYPDPYRRWNARYWDGQLWTGRVAHPGGDGLPLVFGNDPVARPAADAPVVDSSQAMRYEAAVAGELARLRAEVDTWRGVADERARALTSALNAVESLAERRDNPVEPTPNVDPVAASAARSGLATIPDVVRVAARCELLSLNSKHRRWWQRIVDGGNA